MICPYPCPELACESEMRPNWRLRTSDGSPTYDIFWRCPNGHQWETHLSEEGETITIVGSPVRIPIANTQSRTQDPFPSATGDRELPRPRPRTRSANRTEDPGEDPKGAGNSPTGSDTQGEQYPGKYPRSASAGPASDAAKSTRRL